MMELLRLLLVVKETPGRRRVAPTWAPFAPLSSHTSCVKLPIRRWPSL